jgi:hypothetical protein
MHRELYTDLALITIFFSNNQTETYNPQYTTAQTCNKAHTIFLLGHHPDALPITEQQ